MKPEIANLFGELSGVPYERRQRVYAERGTPEAERREVESLLAFDDGPPIASVVESAVAVAFREPVTGGDFCGPFQLLRIIGRGGMGVVYLAERVDGEIHQQVAVKLLRSSLDSVTAQKRFLQERQILARLEHPNIARLIDAGHHESGHPYLVMEYVSGQPIDEYCRSLSVREKVSLMAAVCDGIASAHQKLIVHRDLKPGNIMVDDHGRPRVLDFGIARLVDDSESTATVERRLTPDYASPEQMAGAPVTTATDIYSLGALLYRLLTGAAPPRDTTAAPSQTGAAVDADLDAIVMKAMRPEPRDRYPTVDKLAEDLQAWAQHRPVTARQGERWYRARRFTRRYWPVALAGCLAATGLLVGLIVALNERDVAQQRFDDVRKLANEFIGIEKELRGSPGSLPVRERIVKTSIGYLERLSRRAGNDWRLKQEISAGYRSAAEAQGLSRGLNLGQTAAMAASLDKADFFLREARRAAPEDRSLLRDRVELLEMKSRPQFEARDLVRLEATLQELQSLLETYEKGVAGQPAELRFIAKIYESMASTGKELGRTDLRLSFAKKSVSLLRQSLGEDAPFNVRGALSNSMSGVATLQVYSGDLEGAVRNWEDALAILSRMALEKPEHFSMQVNMANIHVLAGRVLFDPDGPTLNRPEAARPHFLEALAIGRRLLAIDPKETQARVNHGIAAWRYGNTIRTNDPKGALTAYDEAIAVLRPLPPKQFARDVTLAEALSSSALLLNAAAGNRAPAARRIQEAKAICADYKGTNRPVFLSCFRPVAKAQARLQTQAGNAKAAAATFRELLSLTSSQERETEMRKDLRSAWTLVADDNLIRDAMRAARSEQEAAGCETEARSIVEWWRKTNPVAARFLP